MYPANNNSRSTARAGAAALGVALLALPAAAAFAVDLPPMTFGAGLRTSFATTNFDATDEDVSDFKLNSIRLYIGGSVMENINFTFNTEYNQVDDLIVLDAIARFEFSDQFNIWAGRLLPPSDRANLTGPYYANHWGVYRDGVQDGYPFVDGNGRAEGIAYWGQFGKVKLQTGVFDVPATQGDGDLLYAARVMVDLWAAENGYYINSTYYGEKDVLAFGLAAQEAAGSTGWTFDALMEKKLGNAGVITLEGEYASYEAPIFGYPLNTDESDGYFVLASYLFPQVVGKGKFQVLGKFGETTFENVLGDLDQETFEVDLNYIIKDFNARVSLYYIDTSFDPQIGADNTQFGIGLQLQL
jgi:hypothetical protein